MPQLPQKLQQKLQDRIDNKTLRSLPLSNNLIDFSSNDYLGFASNETIYANTFQLGLKKNSVQNGASGSRLLSGNHAMYNELEKWLTQFHNTESALVFNSGYDANIGFFSAVPQRNDIVFYDEFIHASIRDGIKMSNAKSYKFKHNDLEDLKSKIKQAVGESQLDSVRASSNISNAEIYIVTEAIFSMDGDSPDLKKLSEYCDAEGFHLIIDEAHAIGVFGKNGVGLVQQLAIEKKAFARIVTFGKALGCHGAAILGSESLKNYLINFARSIIYTTALTPHTVTTIFSSYNYLELSNGQNEIGVLQKNIALFKSKLKSLGLEKNFVSSVSAIQCCIVSGNDKVKTISQKLAEKGFDVKAILSPTVPEGKERLRFCLHSYNSPDEVGLVLQLLKKYL